MTKAFNDKELERMFKQYRFTEIASELKKLSQEQPEEAFDKAMKLEKELITNVDKLLKEIDDQKIDRQTGCYAIAGLMLSDHKFENEFFEEIFYLCGDLELPDHHVGGDPKEEYKKLKQLVKKAKKEAERLESL